MVASTAQMQETPESIVIEMAQQIQTLAAEGDWTEVENLAVRLRTAVTHVPEAKRRSAIVAVQRAIETVAAEAATAQHDVSGRLTALRRGQKATRAYESR